MNGHRAKKLRRENKARLLAELKQHQVSVLSNASSLPIDLLTAYMISKFVGNAGYNFVSIGPSGSLFVNEKYYDTVVITLHMTFPICNASGRYSDINGKNIVVESVQVPPKFKGFVIDKRANKYIGQANSPCTSEEFAAEFGNLVVEKMTRDKLNEALSLEKPLMEKQIADIKKTVEDQTKNMTETMEYYKKADEQNHALFEKYGKEQAQAVIARAEEILTTQGYDYQPGKVFKDGGEIASAEAIKKYIEAMEQAISEIKPTEIVQEPKAIVTETKL